MSFAKENPQSTNEKKLGIRFSDFFYKKEATQLGMVIDPEKQTPQEAASRTLGFIKKGGNVVFVGGSGPIDSNIFNDTIGAIAGAAKEKDTPIFMLPGDIGQIMMARKEISGVFNYRHIMGSGGNSFDTVYPPSVRKSASESLKKKDISDIATLYVLCGDPNASVSQVSGIRPLNLVSEQAQRQFLYDVRRQLGEGNDIDCIFFESGSNSEQRVNTQVILKMREMIDAVSPQTVLVVSGGIKTPNQAGCFAGIADCIDIGSHFEKNGIKDVGDFISTLSKTKFKRLTVNQ